MKDAPPDPPASATGWRLAGAVAALAAVYLVLARLGLALAFVQANASPVWAPAGAALAALVAGGLRLWPGVFLGALLANFLTSGTDNGVAALLAAGNTAGAAGAAWLLGRLGLDPALRRQRDLLLLALVGGVGASVVTATNGTAVLVGTGVADLAKSPEIWDVWFSGDLVGTLLVAPFALSCWARRLTDPIRPTLEAGLLLAGILVSGWLVFGRDVSGSRLGPGLAFVVFPFAAWAAVRFGVRGSSAASLLVGAGAVVATVLRSGPFAAAGLHAQLFQFQLFVIVLALSSLLLAGASEERARAEEALRAEVEEHRRTEAALVQAKARAEESDRLKSAFLASMSHELRTPLNSIIGFTGIVQQGLAGPLLPEQSKQLGWVRQSAERLLEMVNEVLDVSRLESGQLTVERAPFDLAATLARCVAQAAPAAGRKGLSLTLEVAPDVRTIESDERRVEQVLSELIRNAVKFTEEGSVAVACRLVDGSAVTTVADTGIGIGAAARADLFRPFHQADSGLSRRYEGAGLGLSICKGLLDLLGGDLSLSSEAGRGSVFTCRLPAGARRDG